MKILDYNPILGTLSAGFEHFPQNEVTDVVKLSKDAVFGYNSIHKNWFLSSIASISTYFPEEDVDLAIFYPEFGTNINRRGVSNFFYYDFQNCLDFLAAKKPKFAIIQTEPEAISHLNTAADPIRDGLGQLSYDKIIHSLTQMGYKAHFVVIDEASYGVPLHRSFVFYIATPQDFDLHVPRQLCTETGKGNYAKYRTVGEAIGDLNAMGDWVPYASEAQNHYQKKLRDEKRQKVTWNHPPKIKNSVKQKITSIKAGSNNETKFPKARSKGFNRAKWDSVCRCMDNKFYLPTSSGGDSIHPIENRPFTIREGCRIHGLPDQLSFDLKVGRKKVADMVHKSPSPIVGEILAIALGAIK